MAAKSNLAEIDGELYKVLDTFLLICQCLCVAPLELSFEQPILLITKRSARLKYFKIISQYMWCTVLLASVVTSIYFQYAEFDSFEITFLMRILYVGEYISGIFNSVLIMVACHRQYKRYVKVLIEVSKLIRILETFGVTFDFSSTRIFLRRWLFGSGLFFLSIIPVDYLYNRSNIISFFRSSTVYSIPNVITALALIKYIVLLHVLNYFYSQIHLILQSIQVESSHHITNRGISIRKGVFYFMGNDIPDIQRQIGVHRSVNDMKIDRLRGFCLELGCMHRNANEAFGLLLVSTVVSTFLILNIQFYTFYTIIERLQKDNIWLTIYTIMWVVLHGAKTFFVLLSNHSIKVSKTLIVTSLYRLDVEKSSVDSSVIFLYYTLRSASKLRK